MDGDDESSIFDNYQEVIEAFKIKPFTKRYPQVYEDKKRGYRLESSYIEFSGRIEI